MKDTAGIILTDHISSLSRILPDSESTAMLPVCGKYRLIDFALSAMQNAGITRVGVSAGIGAASLYRHLGAGHTWDMARSEGGLFLAPPEGDGICGAIRGLLPGIRESRIVLCTESRIFNMSLAAAMEKHNALRASVTSVCTQENGEDVPMGIYVLSRGLLSELCRADPAVFFTSLRRNCGAVSFRHTGYTVRPDSPARFLALHHALLHPDIYASLFRKDTVISTKARAEAPARYGKSAHIRGCLVAGGCRLEGTAENCFFFRDATLKNDAHLKNCVILHGAYIDSGVRAENAIITSRAFLPAGSVIKGSEKDPAVVG